MMPALRQVYNRIAAIEGDRAVYNSYGLFTDQDVSLSVKGNLGIYELRRFAEDAISVFHFAKLARGDYLRHITSSFLFYIITPSYFACCRSLLFCGLLRDATSCNIPMSQHQQAEMPTGVLAVSTSLLSIISHGLRKHKKKGGQMTAWAAMPPRPAYFR